MSTETSTFITQLEEKTREELLSLAQREGLENGTTLTSFSRSELLQLVLRNHSDQQGSLIARGILEIMSDGYGFLRQYGLKPQGHRDVYVSQSQIRRFSLRTGDMVAGQVRPPKDSERYFGLIRVEAVNGLEAETARNRPHFDP